MGRNRKRRLLVIAILVLMAGCGIAVYRHYARRAAFYVYTTQQPGEPRRVWHTMHVAWTFLPGDPAYRSNISDLVADKDRLYYTSDSEAGCLDKRFGQRLWCYAFFPVNTTASGFFAQDPDRDWRLSRDARYIYACEYKRNQVIISPPPPPAAYRCLALDPQTGKVAWEHDFDAVKPPPCALCPVGDMMLVATWNGDVTALRCSDGGIAWQQQMLRTRSKSPGLPSLALQAEGRIGVVQLGAGRLIGFQVSDGKRLWTWPRTGEPSSDETDGSSEGFTLKHGVVYALLGDNALVAIQAATGKLLWIRHAAGGSSTSTAVMLQGDYVLSQPFGTLAAVRRTDGATTWFENIEQFNGLAEFPDRLLYRVSFGRRPMLPYIGDATANTLYVVTDCAPLLNGAQPTLRSLQGLDTLLALNLATGRERWRWQPDTGFDINQLIADEDRFYISDGSHILAVEEGIPDPLPTDKRERAHLAQRMVNALFQWPGEPVESPSFFQRLLLRLPFHATPHPKEAPHETEAKLTLLHLGRDSVPLLLAYVQHIVQVEEGNAPYGNSFNGEPSDALVKALDLLSDLDARSIVPDLARELDHAKNPASRKALAETLLRFGDARAWAALFRYAKSRPDDMRTRENALYFVCRSASVSPTASAGMPSQTEVTAYLMACLRNAKAPGWLRRFAKFELLDDRGDTARRAALAIFHREYTARWLPFNPVLKISNMEEELSPEGGFPTGFQPESLARDATGRWWAAFQCDYLHPTNVISLNLYHLWFVQSRDKRHWIKPTFGFDLAALCTQKGSPNNIRLTCRENKLCVDWQETIQIGETTRNRIVRHHNEVTIAGLYRDSDHDGLPDRIEQEIGTDPANPDTNGNGIPDGRDKDPLYRPHVLTDEEGIYQATVEALCQFGRSVPQHRSNSSFDEEDLPTPFGCSTRPLVLLIPPGSAGIQILGHPGMVLCRPLKPGDYSSGDLVIGSGRFLSPHIGLDGVWQGHDEPLDELMHQPTDPFASVANASVQDKPMTFRDYFPYLLSRDGKQARVGYTWREDLEGDAVGFDIEVRKIGGQWFPVECRAVYWANRHGSSEQAETFVLHPIPSVPTTSNGVSH
jgi:outer membrane protein assembly factor BamB